MSELERLIGEWGRIAWDCRSANHCSGPIKVVELCAACFSAALDAARAEEREACADICDEFARMPRNVGEDSRSGHDAYRIAANHCAGRIRSRGDA